MSRSWAQDAGAETHSRGRQVSAKVRKEMNLENRLKT